MPPPPSATALSDTSRAADVLLRRQCTSWLNGHRPRLSIRQALDDLQRAAPDDLDAAPDTYGEGELTQSLEADMAALLGKEAAVFFHKGVAAQLAALRVWAGPAREAVVALHPQSHLEADEALAYERLMGLRGLRLGDVDRPFGVAELQAAPDRPDVVTIELPLRRGGYRLPPWEDLVRLREWTAERGIPLHLDGARIWEAAAHYDVEPARIAALADSVYASFYKGLGGLGGCVLAGPADFIARVKPWQGRLAGNLWTAFPYVLSARQGLRAYLPRMPGFRDRARSLAAMLAGVDGLRVAPEPPQVNAFQVHLRGDPARLMEGMRDIARRERFWIGNRCVASSLDGHGMIEVVIGDASEDWRDDQVAACLAALVRDA